MKVFLSAPPRVWILPGPTAFLIVTADVLFFVLEDAEELDKDEPRSPPDLCVEDDLDLLGSEQKQAGRLAWGVYRTYWTAVGGLLSASILMSLLLMQGVDLG